MKFKIISIGQKMPDWVNQGYQEYAKRFPPNMQLQLCEIPLNKRTKSSNIIKLMEKEGQLMLSHIPANSRVVALDVKGQSFSSENLAKKIRDYQEKTSSVCLLIGGPEGITPNVKSIVHEYWSLSRLTLPHPMVRVILAETLYRAWTITQNHPYHK